MYYNTRMKRRKAKIRRKPRNLWEPCRIGTIGETYVALNLLERGYEPYMPLPGRSAKYDMLAYDTETGTVYPVSVKTSTDVEKSSSNADGAARHDGGIVVMVQYRMPTGTIRSLMGKALTPEELAQHPIEYLTQRRPHARVNKSRELATEVVSEFVRGLEPGTVLPLMAYHVGCGLSRRTLYRGIQILIDQGVLVKCKWGHYKVVAPPEAKN